MREREIYKSDVGVVRSSKRARRKMRDVSRQIEMGQHRAIRFWIILKMFSCKTMERGHFPRWDSDTSATVSYFQMSIWIFDVRNWESWFAFLYTYILYEVIFLQEFFLSFYLFLYVFFFTKLLFIFFLNIFVYFLLLLLNFIFSLFRISDFF